MTSNNRLKLVQGDSKKGSNKGFGLSLWVTCVPREDFPTFISHTVMQAISNPQNPELDMSLRTPAVAISAVRRDEEEKGGQFSAFVHGPSAIPLAKLLSFTESLTAILIPELSVYDSLLDIEGSLIGNPPRKLSLPFVAQNYPGVIHDLRFSLYDSALRVLWEQTPELAISDQVLVCKEVSPLWEGVFTEGTILPTPVTVRMGADNLKDIWNEPRDSGMYLTSACLNDFDLALSLVSDIQEGEYHLKVMSFDTFLMRRNGIDFMKKG